VEEGGQGFQALRAVGCCDLIYDTGCSIDHDVVDQKPILESLYFVLTRW
jgi:hypothetical protein